MRAIVVRGKPSSGLEYTFQNSYTTIPYTQLVTFEADEFHSAVADRVEEAKRLVEAGFEHVCDFNGVKLFRKRK